MLFSLPLAGWWVETCSELTSGQPWTGSQSEAAQETLGLNYSRISVWFDNSWAGRCRSVLLQHLFMFKIAYWWGCGEQLWLHLQFLFVCVRGTVCVCVCVPLVVCIHGDLHEPQTIHDPALHQSTLGRSESRPCQVFTPTWSLLVWIWRLLLSVWLFSSAWAQPSCHIWETTAKSSAQTLINV